MRADLIVAVARSYEAGLTLQQTAALHGLSYHNVRSILIRAGVRFRKPGNPGRDRGPQPGTKERVLYLRQCIAEGQTIAEAGASLGITKQAVSQLLNRHYKRWREDND